MGNLGRFSALNTKIKAMSPGLVSRDNYQDLGKLDSERAIARYLHENTRFKSVFSLYNIESLKRWEIELIIAKEIIVDFNKLRTFLDGDYRRFIDALLLRYEVRDLKLVLRTLYRKENTKELRYHMMHDRSKEHIDFDKLLNLTSISEVAGLVKGSIFEEAFVSIDEDDISRIEFHMDMVLDAVYFRNLIKSTEKMSKEDQNIVVDAVGLMIDLLNIQWIYRAKKYHHMLDEELLNYTLLGGNISFKKLKTLIYSKDFDQDLNQAAADIGFKLEMKDDEYMQVRMYRFFLSSLSKKAKKYPMTIAPLMYFVNKLEYETRDIISIIEGVRYGVEDTEKLLVRGGH